ncbi:N-formylglutamate amidohydrolase, partial [Burkholderia pseudomallei]|nr:N-formylglutamate amidohydrolase [Burkholderia pseudomallei]MBF3604698.1 N-formylglutamate amidohydrolase [Burkholderia pseudomallei]
MLTFNRHTVALDERFACFVAQPLDAALPIVVDS